MLKLREGSEIICTKEVMGGIIQVGEICQVLQVDVAKDIIIFKCRKYHMASMSFTEYNTHFELYCKTIDIEWISLKTVEPKYSYRRNGNHIYVKAEFNEKKLYGQSKCHKNDTFDLNYGLNLAFLRCENKVLENMLEENKKKLSELKHTHN